MAKETIIIRGGSGKARPVEGAAAASEPPVEPVRHGSSAVEPLRPAPERVVETVSPEPHRPTQTASAPPRPENFSYIEKELPLENIRRSDDVYDSAPPRRRGGPGVLVAGAVVLALLGAGLGLLFTRGDDGQGGRETAAAQDGSADLGLSPAAEAPVETAQGEPTISIVEGEPDAASPAVVPPAPPPAQRQVAEASIPQPGAPVVVRPPAPAAQPGGGARTAPRAEEPAVQAAAPSRPAPRAERSESAASEPSAAGEPVVRASAPAARPSFNCRYARSRSERLVCSDPVLAAADWRLHNAFERAMAETDNPRALRAEQDRWLEAREAAAPDVGNVLATYEERIDELTSR